MNQDDYVQNLQQDLDLLENALFWLRRSHSLCSAFVDKKGFTPEEYDSAETVTSRFARTSDILIQ